MWIWGIIMFIQFFKHWPACIRMWMLFMVHLQLLVIRFMFVQCFGRKNDYKKCMQFITNDSGEKRESHYSIALKAPEIVVGCETSFALLHLPFSLSLTLSCSLAFTLHSFRKRTRWYVAFALLGWPVRRFIFGKQKALNDVFMVDFATSAS